MTVDLRLILTKVKPDTGSLRHRDHHIASLPFARWCFRIRRAELVGGSEARSRDAEAGHRPAHRQRRASSRATLLPNEKGADGWLRAKDPASSCRRRPGRNLEKAEWPDPSITQQTLVLYEGKRPFYATRLDGMRPARRPEETFSTPRGTFELRASTSRRRWTRRKLERRGDAQPPGGSPETTKETIARLTKAKRALKSSMKTTADGS